MVTAFVANAIVRDDASGFAPIVRATSVTAKQIVLGRFIGGLVIAWLGYLAIPVGMAAGSPMAEGGNGMFYVTDFGAQGVQTKARAARVRRCPDAAARAASTPRARFALCVARRRS